MEVQSPDRFLAVPHDLYCLCLHAFLSECFPLQMVLRAVDLDIAAELRNAFGIDLQLPHVLMYLTLRALPGLARSCVPHFVLPAERALLRCHCSESCRPIFCSLLQEHRRTVPDATRAC